MKHTPTPWKRKLGNFYQHIVSVQDEDRIVVATLAQDANLDRIVAAVNATADRTTEQLERPDQGVYFYKSDGVLLTDDDGDPYLEYDLQSAQEGANVLVFHHGYYDSVSIHKHGQSDFVEIIEREADDEQD